MRRRRVTWAAEKFWFKLTEAGGLGACGAPDYAVRLSLREAQGLAQILLGYGFEWLVRREGDRECVVDLRSFVRGGE